MPVDAHLVVEDDTTGTARPLRVSDLGEGGTFAYAADDTAGTVSVPAGARLRRVSVAAQDTGPATVTIGGGDTITVLAGDSFDEVIPGLAVGVDVVIAGAVASYYVSWVA